MNYTPKSPLSLILSMRYAVGRSFRKTHVVTRQKYLQIVSMRSDQEPFQKTSACNRAGVGGEQ